jgi:hypothetical protein
MANRPVAVAPKGRFHVSHCSCGNTKGLMEKQDEGLRRACVKQPLSNMAFSRESYLCRFLGWMQISVAASMPVRSAASVRPIQSVQPWRSLLDVTRRQRTRRSVGH